MSQNAKRKPVLLSMDGSPLRSRFQPDPVAPEPVPTIPVTATPNPYLGVPQLPRIDDAVFQEHLGGQEKRTIQDAGRRIAFQNPLLLVVLDVFFEELDKSCILNATQMVPKDHVKFLLNVIMFATYDMLTAQLEKDLAAKSADTPEPSSNHFIGVDPAVPGEDWTVEAPEPRTEEPPQ